jgi:hypothetical protein
MVLALSPTGQDTSERFLAKAESARAQVVRTLRRRAEAAFQDLHERGGKIGNLGAEARRLKAFEDTLLRLHAEGAGLTEKLLAPLGRAHADEVLSTSPFTRIEHYLQSVQVLVETLRREGVRPGPALETGREVMDGRLSEHARRIASSPTKPNPEKSTPLTGEAYFHYRETFGPSGPEGELAAFLRLDAALRAEGAQAGLDPAIGEAVAGTELAFHQARVEYLTRWLDEVQKGLAAKVGVQAAAGFDPLIRSRLPLLILREGELVRLRGALVALATHPTRAQPPAQQLVAQVDALSQSFRKLAERVLSAARAAPR